MVAAVTAVVPLALADVAAALVANLRMIRRIAETPFPTTFGEFRRFLYEDILQAEHHVALVKGEIPADEPVLVRVHSQCLTGDVFGSLRCECGPQKKRQ